MFRTYRDTIRTPVARNSSSTATAIDEEDCKYTCDSCAGFWNSENEVEMHRRTEHNQKILKMLSDPESYICHTCFHKQKSKMALTNHIKTVHLLTPVHSSHVEREIFICHHCSHIFFNKEMLIIHLRRGETNDCGRMNQYTRSNLKRHGYDCPKCSKRVRPDSLWIHLLHHGIFNIGTCPMCFEDCDSTDMLLDHVKSHAGYYCCGTCGVDSSKESYFVKHVQTHHRNIDAEIAEELPDNKILDCFVPKNVQHLVKLPKRTNLLKGMKLGSGVSVCVLCRKMCVGKLEKKLHVYSQHMWRPEPKQTNKYACECGEKFFNAVLLKHHAFQKSCDYHKEAAQKDGTEVDTSDFVESQTFIDMNGSDAVETVIQIIVDETAPDLTALDYAWE